MTPGGRIGLAVAFAAVCAAGWQLLLGGILSALAVTIVGGGTATLIPQPTGALLAESHDG